MTDWEDFLASVKVGSFTGDFQSGDGPGARSAAIFTHDFVSDHLPLIAEFDA
jgi:hypothetical protein